MFVHDMIHNNPGLAKYESFYNDPEFLKERNYDGKVFDLFECAQFGLDFKKLDLLNPEKGPVFPEGGEELEWVQNRSRELKDLYQGMVQKGIEVYFMMDIIVLPKRIVELYPEILDSEGKIDIRSYKMREVLDVLFEEMFEKFPEISGIYIRYGETYVSEKYFTPYHCGNNPIREPELEYHKFLMHYLLNTVCKKYQRKIFYRTWGFGAFQYDRDLYLKVSDMIEPHPLFYFCIKHTQGDFHRNYLFNQCLNTGKHQQVVEIQCAREYDGKGAYPCYIAGGVINGFEEYDWMMDGGQTQCLKDVFTEDTMIKGMWLWSRGGGWFGPYINGKNDYEGSIEVKDGTEMWPDVNSYVLSRWAKDMSRNDRDYVIEYAKEILKLSDTDAETYYKILDISAHGILLGRGTDLPGLAWNVFWTRDDNVDTAVLLRNLEDAKEQNMLEDVLKEKAESVDIWKETVALAESLDDASLWKGYIVTTCKYGYYLFALYETVIRANVYRVSNEMEKAAAVRPEYDKLWSEWEELYRNHRDCPTLYRKEDIYYDYLGYSCWNGFDRAMKFE